MNFRATMLMKTALAFASACCIHAHAQTLLREATVDELVNRLEPAPARTVTRGLRNIAPRPQPLDLSIQFDFDSARLQPGSRPLLGNLAKALTDARLAEHRILVEGHTDASGSAAYNEALSLRRADSVAAFLAAEGVERSRIETVGKGFSELLRPEQPGAEDNRRVRVQVLSTRP